MKLEALCQNVLMYPRLPLKIFRCLYDKPYELNEVTAVLEGLVDKYGRELCLYFLRRQPKLLLENIQDIEQRAAGLSELLGLNDFEVLLVLRKNPNLLLLDLNVTRERYFNLPKATFLDNDGTKALTLKYPMVLSHRSETVLETVEALRELTYSRSAWQAELATITPSLLAFFLRDRYDLLARLEYLLVTGDATPWRLRDVFKMSENKFAKLKQGYAGWREKRLQNVQLQ